MSSNNEIVQRSLSSAMESAVAQGMPAISMRSQLIRPALAYAAARSDGPLTREFWNGALAIQYAHEASLIHDDIIDKAKTRRGEPTIVESHGVSHALVTGDHLLTASYRLAAATDSIEFVSLFTRTVERTVAGEIAQAKSLGTTLTFDRYRAIAEGKSGELLAAALSLGAALSDTSRIEIRAGFGRWLGLLYQMLDDVLDYCPATNSGKPALGDFKQKRWTLPLLEIADFSFDEPPEEVHRRLCNRGVKGSVLERCVARIEKEAQLLSAGLDEEFDGHDVGQSLIGSWIGRAHEAVASEMERVRPSLQAAAPAPALLARIPVCSSVTSYLGKNSKSFRFASSFLPRDERDCVARVYAFCRVTDDLVDNLPAQEAEPLLDEWMHLARSAYDGSTTGVWFLDRVMSEMRYREIPFTYASDLAEGMRMDLRGETYESLAELRTYTYRVASVVGMWLTELAGVRDRQTLQHAKALGHAMQLTNILRDVGEDARRGRIYLPASRLHAYNVSVDRIIDGALGQRRISSGFEALMEEMLKLAEADYSYALEGVRCLPPSYRRTFTVAAYVYRGIHAEIRRNGYDTLTRRAVTSRSTKAVLAFRALWDLGLTPPPSLRTA